MEAQRELELKGIGVSPGIVAGPVLLLKADDEPLPEYAVPAADVPRELLRLEAALLETRRQLHDIQRRVGDAMGVESAGIFDAHLHVVDDPAFVDEVYREVREKRKNVEKILFEVAERYAETLLRMEDDYLRERAVDIRDVTRRILRNLAGGGGEGTGGLETPRILVARDVAPSEMAAFDRRKILGVVTELGSPTSHTAIMARAMDVPAIVGLRGVTARLADGDRAVLDGVRGRLILHPTPAREESYGRIARSRAIIQKRLGSLKDEPAVTLDGHAVVLSANIEMPADVEAVWARGARGIGLFRSEYLYLTGLGEPSEERQYQAYAEVARKILPESAIIRTVEAGRRHGIWTGVCGEVAGNPILVPLLLGLGVEELSASPGAIPLVKDVIRHVRFAEAQDLAEAAQGLSTGAEILDQCRALVRRAAPEILELAE